MVLISDGRELKMMIHRSGIWNLLRWKKDEPDIEEDAEYFLISQAENGDALHADGYIDHMLNEKTE